MTRYSSIKASTRKITNKTEQVAATYLKCKRELGKSISTIRSNYKNFNIPKSSIGDAVKRMRAGKPIIHKEGIAYQNSEVDYEIVNWLDSGVSINSGYQVFT